MELAKEYYFCHYRQYIHAENHEYNAHYIIPASEQEILPALEMSYCTFTLVSLRRMNLAKNDLEDVIIKSLVMDGESLLKRLRKKSRQTVR